MGPMLNICRNIFRSRRVAAPQDFKYVFHTFAKPFPKMQKCFEVVSVIGLGTKRLEANVAEEERKQTRLAQEKDISKSISSAEHAIIDQDYITAQSILEGAMNTHEKSNTIGLMAVYDLLATVAQQLGKTDHAIEVLERAIGHMAATGVSPDHNSVVSFRLKLARLLSKLGRAEEAEAKFRQCMEIHQIKNQVGLKDDETEKLQVSCLFWYGKHLLQNKRYFEAQKCFETAFALSVKLKSLQNDQVMVLLYNLSNALIATGESDAAKYHLLSAILIGRTDNSPDLPLYFIKLGSIYLNKGSIKDARYWCETGVECAKKTNNKFAQKEGEDYIQQINEMLKLGSINLKN